MNSSNLSCYGSNSRKRYTLRLLSLCLGRSTPVSEVQPPFNSLFIRYSPFHLALHLCFCQDITKWCKIYTKTDFWFQISHEEFRKLHTGSGRSKKLKFDGLLLSKKHIPWANTLHTEDLSTLLSTTCSTNSLYHYSLSF